MLTGVAGRTRHRGQRHDRRFRGLRWAVYNKSAQVANGMAYERRTSMGLGMSVGDHRAFGLDFSRITDTDSFLGNVEEMMTDPGKTGATVASRHQSARISDPGRDQLHGLDAQQGGDDAGPVSRAAESATWVPGWNRHLDAPAQHVG